jgi:hypothetical protein
MSAAAGSFPPPPPPGRKASSKDTGHAASSLKANIPLSGDGKTHVLGCKKTYFADDISLPPGYRRASINEVHFVQLECTILEAETYEVTPAKQIFWFLEQSANLARTR